MAARYRTGDPVAQSFGLGQTQTLAARPLGQGGQGGAELGFTHISLTQDHLGRTPQIPEQDAFVVALYLSDLPYHELWSRGRRRLAQGYAANGLRIVHLGEGYSAHVFHPHEALSIHVPRRFLDGFADDAGIGRIAGLHCEPGRIDPVAGHLVAALLPAIRDPAQGHALFVDHVALALCAHLARTYGDGGHWDRAPRGGLSPLQERRAKEALAAGIRGGVTLDQVAQVCGLSRGHLARAFRTSTGLSPHQWLQRERIARVKDALLHSPAAIAEIALACGFADQSHLTRVFSRQVGLGPAAWRRQHGGAEPVRPPDPS